MFTFSVLLQLCAAITVCSTAMVLTLRVAEVVWCKLVKWLNRRYGWELYDPSCIIVTHKGREELL